MKLKLPTKQKDCHLIRATVQVCVVTMVVNHHTLAGLQLAVPRLAWTVLG
jgi:hypothetical protein